MSKQRFNVFLTLIIVLLIVAGICAWVTAGNKSIDTGIEESEPVSAPSASVETGTPEATPAPKDTPSPTATPEASDEPEESDDPSIPKTRTLNLSGDIDASTGTNLSMSIKWTAVSKNDETVRLTATLYMYSYTMHYGSAAGSISVNGVSKDFVSAPINYDNTDQLQEVKLCTITVDLPIAVGESASIPLSATWNFDGVYNGQEISGITVSDYVLIEG